MSTEETIESTLPAEKASNVEVQPNTSTGQGTDEVEESCFCKVSVAYSSEMENELQLEEDDVIQVLSKRPDGWWTGILREQVGLFPSSFVVSIPKPQPAQNTNTDEDSKYCKVLVAYSPDTDDELQLEENDIIEIVSKRADGWWTGRLRDQVGLFPSTFVRSIPDPTSSSSPSPAVPASAAEAMLTQCRVVIPFNGNDDDELILEEGDVITIVSKDVPNEGWWKGVLRGRTGIFPRNFVEELTTRQTEDIQEAVVASEIIESVRPETEDPASLEQATEDPELEQLAEREEQSQALDKILERLKLEEEKKKCVICMECDINSGFFPCGHITCCVVCSSKCELCPICRSKIERTERVYLPS